MGTRLNSNMIKILEKFMGNHNVKIKEVQKEQEEVNNDREDIGNEISSLFNSIFQ